MAQKSINRKHTHMLKGMYSVKRVDTDRNQLSALILIERELSH
jgi:hypothetical protein